MWLLLIHRVPSEPGYLWVKVRRRLRGIGAVWMKSTVYVLPLKDAKREAFEWRAREIRANGGDASVIEARLIGGLSNDDVSSLFRADGRRTTRRLRARLHRSSRRILRKTSSRRSPASGEE